jgi:hypothetical protein
MGYGHRIGVGTAGHSDAPPGSLVVDDPSLEEEDDQPLAWLTSLLIEENAREA